MSTGYLEPCKSLAKTVGVKSCFRRPLSVKAETQVSTHCARVASTKRRLDYPAGSRIFVYDKQMPACVCLHG